MNDRKKLIELLKVDPCPSPISCSPYCEYVNHKDCFLERYADHLLAHGVTVREPGEWKHGRRNGEYGIWCSKCGTGWPESLNYEVIAACHKFCPNCGAPMKGESNDLP